MVKSGTLESISPPDEKMFFCLPVFPMLRLLSHAGAVPTQHTSKTDRPPNPDPTTPEREAQHSAQQ